MTKNANKYQPVDIESQERPKSTFRRFRDTCKKKWKGLFGKGNTIPKYESVFPLVETTTLPNSYNAKSYSESNAILEKQLFDQKMNELISEDSVYYDPNYQSISLSDDKIKFSNSLSKSSGETDNFDISTLQVISEKIDELEKDDYKNKRVKFNIDYTESESESESESEYGDSESDPLFHKSKI
jgi:hypothetical protein